jgi:serralysin
MSITKLFLCSILSLSPLFKMTFHRPFETGIREGRNPSPNFNTADYLLAYPDVAAAHTDPLAHYLQFGEFEGRLEFPVDASTAGPIDGFDPNCYLGNNPDVAAAHVNPFQHYLQYDWHEGRNVSADFNTNFYEAHNPDVAAAGIDPLIHYDQYGCHEGATLRRVLDLRLSQHLR